MGSCKHACARPDHAHSCRRSQRWAPPASQPPWGGHHSRVGPTRIEEPWEACAVEGTRHVIGCKKAMPQWSPCCIVHAGLTGAHKPVTCSQDLKVGQLNLGSAIDDGLQGAKVGSGVVCSVPVPMHPATSGWPPPQAGCGPNKLSYAHRTLRQPSKGQHSSWPGASDAQGSVRPGYPRYCAGSRYRYCCV